MFSGLSGSEVDPGSYTSRHGLGLETEPLDSTPPCINYLRLAT